MEITFERLFDWKIFTNKSDNHVMELAITLSNAAKLFTNIINSYNELCQSKNRDAVIISELTEKVKNLEHCSQCDILQQQLEIQNSKFKQLASVFGEVICENKTTAIPSDKIEKAQDFYTQMINDSQDVEIDNAKKRKKISPCNEEAKKSKTGVSSDEDIQEFKPSPPVKKITHKTPVKQEPLTQIDFERSPILGKNKGNKSYKSDISPITKEKSQPSPKTPIRCKMEPIDELQLNTSTPMKPPSVEIKKKKRSISLLKNPLSKGAPSLEGAKGKSNSKKLKQAKLVFTNVKEKPPLDVTRLDDFCGGMRSFSESPSLKTALQLADNRPSEDDDIIEASPCDQESKNERKKRRTLIERRSNLVKVEKENLLHHPSDDETMYFPPEDDHLLLDNKPVLIETVPKEINKEERETLKTTDVDKKPKKAKLPGWSCKDCKNFYEVAFKDNEKVLRAKMEECLKHRKRFNSIKSNTPPGFWDLRMPPTQPTEVITRQDDDIK